MVFALPIRFFGFGNLSPLRPGIISSMPTKQFYGTSLFKRSKEGISRFSIVIQAAVFAFYSSD
jgi:hypothetical protein